MSDLIRDLIDMVRGLAMMLSYIVSSLLEAQR